MDVIAIEPFTAKSEHGEYKVTAFAERFEVISGFQILKFRNESGEILICPEEYLGTKLIEPKDLAFGFRSSPIDDPPKEDFLKEEDMTL